MATVSNWGKYYPVYSDNSSWASGSSSTITYTLQGNSTNGIIFNGPVAVTPAAPIPPLSEIDRLLADVESVCCLAR